MSNDISFLEGTGILALVLGAYWLIGQGVLRAWGSWLHRYLDRHPDVEVDLVRRYGKVRRPR